MKRIFVCILFSAVLLSPLPFFQTQQAFAHQHPGHDVCFEQVLNSFTNIWIIPKPLALLLGWVFSGLCPVKTVAPVDIILECNTKSPRAGFRFNTIEKVTGFNFLTTKNIEQKLQTPDGKEILLGRHHAIFSFIVTGLILGPDAIASAIPGPGGLIAGFIFGLVVSILVSAFIPTWEQLITLIHPGDGFTAQTFFVWDLLQFGNPTTSSLAPNNVPKQNVFFGLGINKVNWKSDYLFGDSDIQHVSIVDNISPVMTIHENPVTVEANVHWGFDKSFALEKLGPVTAKDNCVPDSQIIVRPLSVDPDFFPLTKLKEQGFDVPDQLTWEALDQEHNFVFPSSQDLTYWDTWMASVKGQLPSLNPPPPIKDFIDPKTERPKNPIAIKFGSDIDSDNAEDLFVANGDDSSIWAYSGPGGFKEVSGVISKTKPGVLISKIVPSGSGGLNNPVAIIFGSDQTGDGVNDLFVASANTNQVLVYDGKSGAFIIDFVIAGSGGLNTPAGLAFGPDQNRDGINDLYVSSKSTNKILVYDGVLGGFIEEFATEGLQEPTIIEFGFDFNKDGAKDLYVTSKDGIKLFNGRTGDLVGTFVSENNSVIITFGPDGSGDDINDLYIGLPLNTVFDVPVKRYKVTASMTTGTFIDNYVAPGSGGLSKLSTMTFGPDSNFDGVEDLYVVDNQQNKIILFNGKHNDEPEPEEQALAIGKNMKFVAKYVTKMNKAVIASNEKAAKAVLEGCSKPGPKCSPDVEADANAKKADAEIQGKKAKKIGAALSAFALALDLFQAFVLFEPEPLDAQRHPPNYVSKVQTIIVRDTLSPDILPPDTISKEIVGDDIDLEIFPPLIFDIADPRPTIMHNLTSSKDCKKTDPDSGLCILVGDFVNNNFKPGITPILWEIVDFSGNRGNTTQLVNIKNMPNDPPVALDGSVTNVFSEIPTQVQVSAINRDKDPIEFFMESNPDNGFILSPIDPIFQNKFQEEGAISTLKGITRDKDDNTIYFGDTINQRLMKLTENNEMTSTNIDPSKEVSPSAISLLDDGNFMMGDWRNEKIVKVTPTGSVLEQFNVTGMFEDPKNFVADSSDNLYLTDGPKVTTFNIDSILNSPYDIAIDANDLIVTDKANNRALKFDTDGNILEIKFGSINPGFDMLNQPTGVHIDSSNDVYISDTNNNRVAKFDNTGAFLLEITESVPGTALDSPKGVITNSLGNLLVVDNGNNRTQKYDSLGNFIEGFGKSGIELGNFTNPSDLDTLSSILIDDFIGQDNAQLGGQTEFILGPDAGTDGIEDIYIANANTNEIFLYNGTTGAFEGIFVAAGAGGLDEPTGLVFGPDAGVDGIGDLYVASNKTDSILLYNGTTGASEGTFVNAGAGGLDEPTGLVFGPDAGVDGIGDLYVASNQTNTILLYNGATGAFEGTFVGVIPDGIIGTQNMVFGPDISGDNIDELYIANSKGFIRIHNGVTGNFIDQYLESATGGVTGKVTLAFDPLDQLTLFVSVLNQDIVKIYDTKTRTLLGTFATVLEPRHLTFGADDNLLVLTSSNNNILRYDRIHNPIFVADTGNNRIQKFDTFGNFSMAFGPVLNNGGGELNSSKSVSVSNDGTIYVADTGNHRIVKLDSFGNFVSEFGELGDGQGQFNSPTSVNMDDGGNIYVADKGNHRIQKFTSTGSFVKELGNVSTKFDFGLNNMPEGIATDLSGDVYIADWAAEQIVKLGRDAELGANFEVMNITGKFKNPQKIAIDSSNNIFVTDLQTQEIVKLGTPDVRLAVSSKGILPQGIAIRQSPDSEFGDTFLDGMGGPGQIVFGPQGNFFISEKQSTGHVKLNKFDAPTEEFISTELEFSKPPIPRFCFSIKPDFSLDTITGTPDIDITHLTMGPDQNNDGHEDLYLIQKQKTTVDISGPATSAFCQKLINDFESDENNFQKLHIYDVINHKFLKTTGISLPEDATQIAVGGMGDVVLFSDSNADAVGTINADTGEIIDVFVEANSNGLVNPTALEFGPDANGDGIKDLYVSSADTNEIKTYDGKTGEPISNLITGGLLDSPADLVFGPFDSLYVVNSPDQILRYNGITGDSLGLFANGGSLDDPKSMAFGPDGDLYVSNAENIVLSYDVSRDAIFVADWQNELITMLDFDSGNVIKEFDVSGLYGSPQDLAVEKMNEIVTFTVTDSKLGKLVLVDSDKGIKEKLMMPDSTDLGALSFKPGIEVDSLVFINASDRSVNQIDTFNNIQKIFTFDNTFEPNAITVNGSRLTLLDEQFVQMLMQPSDFAFDSDSGKIYVSDKNDQDVEIRRYTADDGTLDSQLKKFKKTSDTRFEKQDIFSSHLGITIPVDKACRVQTDKIFTANSMNVIPDVNGDGTDDLIIHLTEETFVDRTKIGVLGEIPFAALINLNRFPSIFSEIYNKINCPDEFSSSSSLMVLDGKTGNGISGKTKQVTQGTESDVIVGGPNNEVLLASNMGGFIERFDADNFELKGKINGLNKPDGLSFGPDANGDGKDDLYVSNSGNNTILHFDGVTYESLGAFVSPDTIDSDNLFSVVSAEIIRPTSLAFGPDKNLYVKTNTDVMVFQGPGGINPGSFVEGLGLSQSEEDSLISIADLKFSPTNQNLYLLDSEKGQIDRYDGNGGNIFVADWDKKSIKELAPTGQLLGTIDFVANLNNPENIALDNVGKTFWITDSGDQKLVKLDADGMEKGIPIDVSNIISGAITSFAIERPDGTMDRRDNDGNLIGPQDEEIFSITPVGIDLDSINNIYISDWAKENLIILDEQGNFVDRFGLNGTLKDPIDLTINEVSNEVQIFVSENDTPEIVRLDRDGLVQTVPANVELDGITQIEDDPNDRKFFLTDMSNPSSLERIQQLNLADEMPIPITDIFVDPEGIEIVEKAGGDDFYIGDWKDLRIIRLDDDGDKTGLFVPDFYFQNPSDLVVDDPPGNLVNMWIADAKIGKVIKVFFIDEEQEREDLLDVDGRFIFISGVDLDTKGNFYVANVTDNSIRKFDDRANLQATEFFPQGFQLADNIWVSGKDEVYIPLSDPVPALWHLNSTLEKIELGLIGYGSKIGAPQFGETVSSGTANAVIADSQDNILIATTDGYLEKIKMIKDLTFDVQPFGPIDFFESDGVLKEPGSKLVRTDVVFNLFGFKFTIFTGIKEVSEECMTSNSVGNFCKKIGDVLTNSKFTDMATGVDDRLYVVDENLNRVHKYDLNGATLLDQMCSPRDLTFGRDLNQDDDRELLSTTCDGKIALYDGENGVLLQENFISDVLMDIKAITFGPDENLYVYNTNAEDEILIYNGESGDFIAKFSVFGAGMTSGKAPADILFGRDCDADDETTLDLYVSNGGTDRILCFQGPNSISPNTFIRDFVSTGSTLNVTSAIAFGPDRNDDGEKELYVASGDDDKIVVFDGVTGNPLPGDEFEFISKGEGGLDVASELVFDINEENLLVSSQNTDQVIQFNATDGQFIQNFNRGGEELLDGPNGLIFSPNDNTLFVASEANEHILRYAATGNFLEKFNKGIYMGWAGKCDSGPSCDGNNQVSKGFACTSDTCSFVFSAGEDPTAGTDDGQFNHPDHIDVDPVGNVFISDQPQENVPAQTAPNRVFACQSLSQVTFSTGKSFNYGFPQTICVDIIVDLVEREQARQNGIKFIQVCSQVVRGFCTNIPTEGSISMLQTMPRVQKLSNDGFFIVDAISDITKLELAGNFDVTRSIAVDRDRLYVADVKKLHFFDVNPFSSVLFDPETNVTSSFVTYSSNPSFVGFDDFEFLAFDGFDSSVGKINVTVNDPDLDRDGITLALDKNPTKFSDEFSDVPVNGVTSGVITERGGQVLTVRDESDPTKGVFILAGFFGTSPPANIELCGGSVKLHLVEGNSLIVRCEDPEINVIRGPVSVELFDVDNRIGTVMLQKDETLKFNPGDSVLGGSPANKNTINVDFSAGPLGSKIYPIAPRDKRIFIDTELPKITCPSELTVGTFSPKGTPLESVEITNAFAQIKVTDLKDPNPGIENAPLRKINDAPDFFNLGFAPTTVNFTGIDEIGNTSFCSTEVTVADLDDPIITPPPEITVETPLHSDVVVVDYKEGKAEDLFPNGAMVELETPSCNPAMGSLFGLGTSPITCTATDESGRVVTKDFLEIITVVENPRGVIIESATATGKNLDGVFSDGDEIIVKFSQDTNRPDPTPSESGLSKSDIDTIFKISKGDDTPESLGTNYTGTYLTPSILAIEITNSTDGSPTPDDTKFTINPGANLKNAAQTIDGNTLESTTLTGSFATIQGPQIIALVASGDAVMGTEFMGNVYNNHTKILLKFSEPTNAPNGVGLIISKDKVDSLFSFKNGTTPISLGTDYEGQWLTKSKFLVSLINKTNNGGPQIGNTTATVIGDIQNSAETSDLSESVSPPMFGSFGAFTLSKPIEDGGSFTITLPSGIDAEIKLPSGTSGSLSLVKIENTTIRGSVNILGDMIDLSPRESSTCDLGCNILFTFTREDLKGTSFTPNTVTVLHDLDGNGRFDDEGEAITTIITEISPPGTFLANATVFSFSSIALGQQVVVSSGGGGGGGDNSSPVVTSASIIPDPTSPDGQTIEFGGRLLKLDEQTPFTNIVRTGESITVRLLLYDNQGVNAIRHVTLYTNLQGYGDGPEETGTYIRYVKGQPTKINDPTGIIKEATTTAIPRNGKLEVNFDIVFSGIMDKSKIIVRIWDVNRNGVEHRFHDAIHVIESESKITDIFTQTKDKSFMDEEPLLSYDLLKGWAGINPDYVTDSELLKHIGIQGDNIPQWFKESNVAKWVIDGEISQRDFINALEFLSKNKLE